MRAVQRAQRLSKLRNVAGSLIGHPVFPTLVHYTIMWLILLLFKFGGLAPMVSWSAFVPFWVASVISLELSRVFVVSDPTSTWSLYLSFLPFAVFCIASREVHSYLAGLWFIFLLIVTQHQWYGAPIRTRWGGRGRGVNGGGSPCSAGAACRRRARLVRVKKLFKVALALFVSVYTLVSIVMAHYYQGDGFSRKCVAAPRVWRVARPRAVAHRSPAACRCVRRRTARSWRRR